MDVDQRRITHGADHESAAASHLQAGDGRRAGVVADGDRTVDPEGLASPDGDDVILARIATIADDERAEVGPTEGEIERGLHGVARDSAEDKRPVGVKLAGRAHDDRSNATEDDGAVTGHDVADWHDVGVRAGEEERARVINEPATDSAVRGECANLGGGRGTDGGLTRVGVGADEGHRTRGREVKAGLAGAGAKDVLDDHAEGDRAARIGEDGVRGGAAIADELAGRDAADADGEGGHGLVEAAEVEDTHGGGATQRECTDREGVGRPETGGAVGDDRSAGVGVGAAEGQRAAAGVADADLGIGAGLDEGAAEGDRARGREVQRGDTDRAVANDLVGGDALGGEAREGLAQAVEFEGRAVTGAAEDDGIGASQGGGAANDERAVLDARDSGEGVAAREGERAAGRHAADEVARAVDAVGEGEAA